MVVIMESPSTRPLVAICMAARPRRHAPYLPTTPPPSLLVPGQCRRHPRRGWRARVAHGRLPPAPLNNSFSATYLTPSYSSLGSPWHSPSRRCLPVCSASACRLRESDGSELSSPTDSRNGVDGSVRRRGRGPRTGGVRLCGCGSRSGGWHVAPAQATIANLGAGRAACGCLDAADDVCQARALVACEAANDGGSKRAAVRGLRLPFDDGRTEKDGGRR
jgi:hypothetical protein